MKEENEAIIKALNMYGRVPEQWELLNEIERIRTDKEQLNSLVNSCQEEIRRLNKIIEIKNNRIQQLIKRTRSARIDKAIEYIENNLYPVGNDVNGSDLPYDEAIQPLVDILKGSDKE